MGGSFSAYNLQVEGVNGALPCTVQVHDWVTLSELYDLVSEAVNKRQQFFMLRMPGKGVGMPRDGNAILMEFDLRENPVIERVFDVVPWAGRVKRSKVECAVTCDDDLVESRAQMHCGCVISVCGLEQHIRSTLGDSAVCSIPCVRCKNTTWDYSDVRHVLQAKLSDKQLNDISVQLSLAYLRQPSVGVRQCGSCQTYYRRDLPGTGWRWPWSPPCNSNRVVCVACSAESSKRSRRTEEFEFCWLCGQRWIGTDDRIGCGNARCEGPAWNRRTLETCDVLRTPDYLAGCPSIRACPSPGCGCLIQHNDGCKHMTCKMCKTQFCFVCLSVKDDVAGWRASCVSPFGVGKCPVAPRQSDVVRTPGQKANTTPTEKRNPEPSCILL